MDLTKIVSQFKIEGGVESIKPFGSGHINDTYRVKNNNAAKPDYLLQRVNHHVFKNVPGLMFNFKLVTDHIKNKLNKTAGANADREVLTLISTYDDHSFFKDEAGNYWRVCKFLFNTRSYDVVTNSKQAFEGGRAFGKFQQQIADIDPNLILEVIPNFHNIVSRLAMLDEAIKADRYNRVINVPDQIDFIYKRAAQMSSIVNAGKQGKLPLRIIHNDTKFNNVLLNLNDEVQCVIDLDTVMPGYVAYDFGDAVRTIVSTAAEDEPELDKIDIRLDFFEAFVKGYLQETAMMLTSTEIDSLSTGVLLLPYMQGVRFLTDYLEGDHYFKIHSPGHNLQRALAQFRLVSKLEENIDKINNLIIETAQLVQLN
ncbi:phosphotransferase enzyme family protein [Mucilaginibacter sp. AW1-3]